MRGLVFSVTLRQGTPNFSNSPQVEEAISRDFFYKVYKRFLR